MLPIQRYLLPIDFHETRCALFLLPPAWRKGSARRYSGARGNAATTTLRMRPRADGRYKAKNCWARSSSTRRRICTSRWLRIRRITRVKCLVRKGDAASEIVEIAREESVDLIVMPTHGYNGFYRYLIGSVTAKVIHDSECPVLTSAHWRMTPPNLPIKHVLCGVTYSDHSVETLRRAVEVAGEFKAKLTLANVTPSVELRAWGNYVDRPWRDELVLGASEQLAKLQQQVRVKSGHQD